MKHRTYLWLYLSIKGIYQTYRDSLRLNEGIIEILPSSVQDAYEKILSKVNDKQRDTMTKILQIIVGARRPLTLKEMSIAFGFATVQKHEVSEDVIINSNHLEQHIRHWCGLFVFTNHSRIYLIHQTAKEFLLCSGTGLNMISHRGWRHAFTPADIETGMAKICIEYLTCKDLDSKKPESQKLLSADTPWPYLDGEQAQDQPDITGFVTYAAEHWPSHVRHAHWDKRDPLMTKLCQIYDTRSERFHLWFPILWKATRPYENQPDMNNIRLAAFNGHEMVLELLLANKKLDLETKDESGQTALILGSQFGYEKVVQMLLDQGAEVNTEGGDYDNALQVSSAGGHEKVVQMMLDQGAEMNAQSGYYGNALQAASAGGHEEVVQMLLDQGAEANAQGGHYGNALQAVSAGGREKVVQMLRDQGAGVNAQGGDYYDNALQAASAGGHEEVVQMLLDQGAEVNAQGGVYDNALRAASARGHEEVVQMLLNQGAKANTVHGRIVAH
jgi:ankyrin repeat protein